MNYVELACVRIIVATLLLSGCAAGHDPVVIYGMDFQRQRVAPFVYAEFTIVDRLHRLDDPHTDRYHQPPRLAWLTTATEVQVVPPSSRMDGRGMVFVPVPIPMHSISSTSAMAFAKGYDVARECVIPRTADLAKYAPGEHAACVPYFPRLENQFLTYSHEQVAYARRRYRYSASDRDDDKKGDVIESGGRRVFYPFTEIERMSNDSARQIVRDLEDENLWRQFRQWWDRGRQRAEIKYICEYYLERYDGIRKANRDWTPSAVVESRLVWLRKLAATPLATTRPAPDK